MKRLFVWLASVSICTAQTVSIGPFATEGWVDERLQVITNDFATVQYVDDAVVNVEDKIPDVSGFATKAYVDAVSNAIPDVSAFSTVEYVNTTSNNLAMLIDDLVSEDELGTTVSNIVPSWALVPIPPVTAEVDPAFTNWLATTNVVIDDNVGTFVSNVVPSWALVPIPPVTVEVDPAFTNWLATTNSATVQYVDDHKWDWSTQITNPPSFVESEVDPVFTNWLTTTNVALESIQLPPDHTAFTLRYVPNGYRTFYYDGTKSTVGLFMLDNKGDPYISACNGQYARLIDPVFFNSRRDRFEDINGYSARVDTAAFLPTYFLDNSNRFLWLTTNGVLKAGTVATVEDLAGFITTEADPVFNEWTHSPVLVAGAGAMSVNGSTSTAIGSNVKTYSYCTLAVGNDVVASNQFAVAVGVYDTKAIAPYATAVGPYNTASGDSSTAVGMWTTASDPYSTSVGYHVTSHGPGTFNINPTGGLSGFWIGNKNLKTYLETMNNVLYKSTTIEGSESEFQSLKYYDLLDTFVGSRRANRYVSLYGALYVGEKADLVSTAFDPNPGGFTLSVGRGNTEAKGRSSVALGNNVTTADDDSFVTGYGGKVTGKIGFASGKNTRAKGNVSTATGEGTTAAGYASSSSGWFTLASAGTSQAHGKYAYAKDSDSWTWSAGFDATNAPRASLWTAQHADNIESLTNGFYESHGPGTFNIDPIGGTAGFWIGETNLATHLDSSSKIALDAIAPAFSTSNVYTNGDYVIYDRHLYECTNYTGTAGWRAGDWQQTTVTGILGNLRKILDAINGEAL